MPAEKKSRILHPTFLFPMVSIGILVVAFLVYYFPVTTRQEAAINNRAFRTLAAISDNLQERVGAYATVLYQASQKETKKSIQDYLNEQVPGLTLQEPSGDAKCNQGETTVLPKPGNDGTYVLKFHCGKWSADFSVERLLLPYLQGAPDRTFDEVVLANQQGLVLYQTRKTGSRINDLLSFRSAEESAAVAASADKPPALVPFGSSSEFSSLWSMSLAGAAYKLYLVPIFTTNDSGSAQPARLVIGGLLRESRFRAESMKVPAPSLVVLILGFLIILAATWPILKFKAMRTTERVPRRSAVYVFLSTLATVILLCILVLHVSYDVDMTPVDRNLGRLADAIDANFTGEVQQVLKVMASANESQLFREDYAARTRSNAADCSPPRSASHTENSNSDTNILKNSSPQFGDYPYFDRMFWIDGNGTQVVKWEVASQPTPSTPLKQRSYFQETIANHLWSFSNASMGNQQFRVDAIVSKNTGEFLAAVSEPAPEIKHCTGLNLKVFSAVAPLLSLIDPVMPVNYGFAIVDSAGNVQFHSDSTRALRENFINELDDSTELRAALFARQKASFSARYTGTDYRMLSMPLRGVRNSPLSLIVFYDLSEASTLHFAQVLLFGWLTLLYLGAISIFLMMLPHAGRPPTWVWPRQHKRGIYVHIAIVLVLIAAPFFLLIFKMVNPAVILWIAYAVPVFCLGVAILKLSEKDRAIRWISPVALLIGLPAMLLDSLDPVSFLFFSGFAVAISLLSFPSTLLNFDKSRWLSVSNSFTLLCAVSIVTTGVLPCIAFFKVAYDYHEDLSTRREQIYTIQALMQREERVKSHYGNLQLLPVSGNETDVGKWLFVRRRLDQLTDRYDTSIMNLTSGQQFSGAGSRDTDRACQDKLPRTLGFLASIVPFNEAAMNRRLGESSGENPLWTWSREGTNRLRLSPRSSDPCSPEHAYDLPPTRALQKSATNDPSFLYPEVVSELPILKRPSLILSALGFALACFLMFRWLRPTLSQMFLLSLKELQPLPEVAVSAIMPVSENLILLGYDNTREAASHLSRMKDVHVLDFSDLNPATVIDVDAITEPVVVIRDFDRGLGVAETDRRKLQILERIMALTQPKHVVIVTTIDPIYHFGAASNLEGAESMESVEAEHEKARWWRVLVGFKRMRLGGSPHCHTTEECRIVWSACSVPERVALYQLAHDGWVNPRNKAALDHLQRRGLIREIPFEFEDNGFRRFVAHEVSAHDRKAWEKGDTASLWDGIRMMFVVICFGLLAAFLFLNQQSAFGYILTGVGILTPVTKLLSEAQSFTSLIGGKREASK